ncbi:hypothetical protein DL766_008727 [Monosporascus sp. MC13-8B]|uniref:Glucan 1,4-alpha-glucosidase n=1 Tax=Monosporascus cannonballus TaxID=155416 RepID=A0ABY0GWC6_9PEZI|nr:hypothetical protein DL762_008501 [Monosporascus cannonballus]RYO88723.1 hypothetical protein DL763_005892 [Monosporascus cannonballus]RYP18231.1 hypothetical protein DL766_008727 [Monosporascus sp. MC13-8B]
MAGPVVQTRPKLSLQTKPATSSHGRTRRSLLANADPKSPTSFNTLSNVYVTAIERSTPVQSTPLTAINTQQPLRLQTDSEALKGNQQWLQAPSTAIYPDTPLSANPVSPAQQMDIVFPSQQMTATPPLSAGATEPSGQRSFSFPNTGGDDRGLPVSPARTRRRVMYASFGSAAKAPYNHNRSLHSILRNSPLPPASAKSPISPRRQSRRLQEKAARRVGYESPLTQTITTEKYTRSHIDLLVEEASPYTPSPAVEDSGMVLDLAMAYSGDETRDGGQTPGPFEEMRRRMTGLGVETPVALSPRPDGGVRKRSSGKKKEKKRRWVWTIGNQDDEDDESGAIRGTREAVANEASTSRASVPVLVTPRATASVRAGAKLEPLTAVQVSVDHAVAESESEAADDGVDVEMSGTESIDSSRATTPYGTGLDVKTPTVATALLGSNVAKRNRLGSVDLMNPETGHRGDTPIPPDLVKSESR